MFYFTTRKKLSSLPEGAVAINVSSRGQAPYNRLSPFYPHGGIPVPNMPGVFSDSVEGIWQGLKIIDGDIDPSYFKGRGRKRRGKPEGHKAGDLIRDYHQARYTIYLTSYKYMLYSCEEAKEVAFELFKKGVNQDIWLYDFGTNPDIDDLSKPLAHAGLLVKIFNENLDIYQKYKTEPDFRHQNETQEGFPTYPFAHWLIEEKEVRRRKSFNEQTRKYYSVVCR